MNRKTSIALAVRASIGALPAVTSAQGVQQPEAIDNLGSVAANNELSLGAPLLGDGKAVGVPVAAQTLVDR